MVTLAPDQKIQLLKVGPTVCYYLRLALMSGQAFYASVPLYQCSLGLTKISILLQYLRVFRNLPVCRVIFAVGAVCITYGAQQPCLIAAAHSADGTRQLCGPL